MAGKSLARLTADDARERAETLKDVLHGQTLNRRERRRIEALALPDLREFARKMDVVETMQAKGAEQVEIETAVLDRMTAAVGTARKAK